MNPYNTPINVDSPSKVDAPSIDFGQLLLVHLAGCFSFALSIVVFTIAFWGNETAAGVAMLIYSVIHLACLGRGLMRTGHARPLLSPTLAIALFLFLYNRHWMAEVDSSPFSDGVSWYDQRAIGWFAYLRVFDQPNAQWGSVYVDFAALACDIELLVLAVVVMGGARWMWTPSLNKKI